MRISEILQAYGYGKILGFALCVILAAALLVFFRRKIWQNRAVVFPLAGIFLLSALPALLSRQVIPGHDIMFHMIRLESLAQQLKNGVFPVRMDALWMEGYGYPVPVLYNDLFLYLPALMRIAGLSLKTAYKTYLLLVNLATVLLSWRCFTQIFRDRAIGGLLCLLYCMSTYRLLDLHTRAAVGEYSAFAFYPVLALAIWEIFDREREIGVRQMLLLAAGMTGIVSVHNLSIGLAGIGMLAAFLSRPGILRKKHLFPVIGGAASLWLPVNAYFLVPFFDYMKTVPMYINSGPQHEVPFTGYGGTVEVQAVFRLFDSIFGSEGHIHDYLPMTPGPILLLALVVGAVLLIPERKNGRLLFLWVWSVFFLVLSTALVPWGKIVAVFPAVLLLDTFQFSWRFLTVTVVLLTLLAGECLVLLRKRFGEGRGIRWAICGIALAQVLLAPCLYSGLDLVEKQEFRGEEDLDLFFVGGAEYLRYGSSIPTEMGTPYFQNAEGRVTESVGSTRRVQVDRAGADSFLELPVFHYKGYVAENPADGGALPITDGTGYVIRVLLPENYSGEVLVRFREPWYWRAAEILSLMSLPALAALVLRGRRRTKADGAKQ
ncbi:MAG: hypothetical protein IKR61_02580 [Lachnospiraceae bacterium]|nr:hypothetical protein [Lachnospiraceae bacterium]